MPHELELAAISAEQLVRRRAFLLIHPDYRELLSAHSLDRANALLCAKGDIISGHPDRHVLRVRIGAIDAILKREHTVPWKDRWANWRAGFGWVSVSIREAILLERLVRCGVDVPEWMAAGESADGRAFLLIRSIEQAHDLRRYLHDWRSPAQSERRSFFRRLAQQVARIHALGYEYPDLYAKHILIEAWAGRIVFLDWQRSRRSSGLNWRARCRDLAGLNASLSDELASPADRFTFLLAYYRFAGDNSVSFDWICRRIERRSRQLLKRSSIREQRLPTFHESQPLVWLDGEALCATPLGQSMFDRDSLERIAYGSSKLESRQTQLELPDGRYATLARRVTTRRLARVADSVRQKHWISPEARSAAELLRRERLGEPPRLLAFGQRMRGYGVVESFLLARDGETL